MFINFLFYELLVYIVEYNHRNIIYKVTINEKESQLD